MIIIDLYFRKARELFIKPEEALVYLEERGAAMNGERATILESLGRLSDAAEIHFEDGQTSKAIALFLKDQNTERASDAVLRGLWEQFSFGVLPDTKNAPVSDLLETAAQIDVSAISQSQRDEVIFFIIGYIWNVDLVLRFQCFTLSLIERSQNSGSLDRHLLV
jgi:hypothetical protein